LGLFFTPGHHTGATMQYTVKKEESRKNYVTHICCEWTQIRYHKKLFIAEICVGRRRGMREDSFLIENVPAVYFVTGILICITSNSVTFLGVVKGNLVISTYDKQLVDKDKGKFVPVLN
jgi:hypothetical protein